MSGGKPLKDFLLPLIICVKALLQLARSLHMRDPVVLVSSFDRPLAAYKIWPNQKLQAGWQGLRQFVTIEHPEHAHIIDNKLMDMVSSRVAVCARSTFLALADNKLPGAVRPPCCLRHCVTPCAAAGHSNCYANFLWRSSIRISSCTWVHATSHHCWSLTNTMSCINTM